MSEFDEWGEPIETLPEGVFDESALGAVQESSMRLPQYPKTTQLPQYPKVPRVATAGLGTGIDDILNLGAETGSTVAPRQVSMDEFNRMGQEWNQYQGATGSVTKTGSGGGLTYDQRMGIATATVDGITDIAGGIMGMVTGYQESQTSQRIASQQLSAQMRLLDEQIAASRDARERANLQAQRDAAAGALSSGNLEQILAALQAAQGPRVPTWVWVVGGVVLLGVGGVVIWKLVDKK